MTLAAAQIRAILTIDGPQSAIALSTWTGWSISTVYRALRQLGAVRVYHSPHRRPFWRLP